MHRLRTAALVLLITAGLYAAADYLVGLWRAHDLDLTIIASTPAYRGQGYVNADFIREKSLEPGQWLRIPGQPLVAPTEFHGTYFNVDRLPPTGNPYRRTANPPADARPERVVLIVGGSTVYGPETPDDFTIASQLSGYLNAHDPSHRYVVYNAGVVQADSTEDRDRVVYELSAGLRPDVVVACDGQLDIVYGVYQGRPGETAPLLAARTGLRGFAHRYLPTNIAQMVWLWLHERAVARHEIVAPAHVSQAAAVRPLDGKVADIYRRNHLAMGDLAAREGALFLSVLPPSPYSTSYDRQTGDIAGSRAATDALTPGLAGIEPAGQAALAGVLRDLAAGGRHTLDLSDVFKDKTDDVFVDLSHLNGTGSRVIAEKIGAAVLRLLAPPPS